MSHVQQFDAHRCLEFEIWRFLWWWQTTGRQTSKTDCFTPRACTRGNYLPLIGGVGGGRHTPSTGVAEGQEKWCGNSWGEVDYPGIKLQCTGQSAVGGSYIHVAHIWQYTKTHNVIVIHSAVKDLKYDTYCITIVAYFCNIERWAWMWLNACIY